MVFSLLFLYLNFRRLKTKEINAYEIGDDIRSLEFDNDSSYLVEIKKVVEKARTDETAHIAAFGALIQMEEATNSKRVAKYDLTDVKLQLSSRNDQIFRIELDVNCFSS